MAELTWYPVDRQSIGDVVLGAARLKGLGSRSIQAILGKESSIAVGFALPQNRRGRDQLPALFVIDDAYVSETMSWLRVYDRPTFPLSQFGRVIGAEDLFLLDEDLEDGASRSDAWACVVLGEVLAQSEYADSKLSAIPLSHAASSFSHVVARAALLHGKGRATDLCIRRLEALEADASLGRKPMSTQNLGLIWSFLKGDLGLLDSDDDILTFIGITLRGISRNEGALSAWEGQRLALVSDSVEARMLAFSGVLSEVVHRSGQRDFSEMEAGLFIAAAAFLAGRGTGHYFLLRRSGSLAASASLWFGLLAGLRGRAAWDEEWIRATKGIERQLRQGMVWADPPMSDVGWLEYNWLAKTVSGPASLHGLARQNARALAVEVLPGVVCQMRTMHSEPKMESHAAPSPVVENELRAALEQFLILSDKTRKVLGKAIVPDMTKEPSKSIEQSTPSQKSFFGPSKSKRSPKKS